MFSSFINLSGVIFMKRLGVCVCVCVRERESILHWKRKVLAKFTVLNWVWIRVSRVSRVSRKGKVSKVSKVKLVRQPSNKQI